jgi:hypothetical protein
MVVSGPAGSQIVPNFGLTRGRSMTANCRASGPAGTVNILLTRLLSHALAVPVPEAAFVAGKPLISG